MPAGSVYAPVIPNVTAPPVWRKKLPDILEALKKPPMSDERAKALEAVAKSWFDAHRWYIREATECEAHDKGDHYGYYDEARGLWIGNTLDQDPDRVRITINLTKAVIDQATAMLTQDAPIFRTTTGQPGVAAAAANETARAFLDHAWRFHNLDDLYRATGRSSFTTGTAFVLLEWDKTQGPIQLVTNPDGSPVMRPKVSAEPEMPEGVGPEGLVPPAAEEMEPVYAPQGELRYRALMRDQVAFDPTSRVPGGRDGIGVIVKWRESRARLMQLFPDKFNDLPETGQKASAYGREETTQRATAQTQTRSSDEEDDSFDVLAFYLRSREGRPRGDCMFVCEGKMLKEGENDIYPSEEEIARGELWPAETSPLYAFIADERENCPWGRARTVDAIPIQHAINGAMSKALQHAAVIANVKYVLPSGLPDEPNDQPGQTFRIPQRFYQMTGGHPVQMTQPPQMPEYLTIVATAREQLEVVVGINAASMGNAPTAEPSGTMIQKLQQRDNSRIAPIKRSHDNQWGRLQTYALRMIRRFGSGERLLRIVGEDQIVQQKFFKVANLAAGTEVYVVNDTSLPRDPQARVMFLQNVTNMTAQAKTPEHEAMLYDLLRMPDIADYLQRASPHRIKAIRNNRLLLLGESDGTQPPAAWPKNTPVPAPWDNPLIHKAELERFLTSPEYLDRVTAEKKDPVNMGQSPLEQRSTALWSWWAKAAVPQAPMMPGAPPAGAPPAAPPGQEAEMTPPMMAAA